MNTTAPPTTVDELERALLSIAQRHLSGRKAVQATPSFIREAAAAALDWAAEAYPSDWCDDIRTRAAALRANSTGGG